MKKDSNIVVFGGSGMFGSAIVHTLHGQGFTQVHTPHHSEVDLLSKESVGTFIEKERPEYIFMIAGLVGGIVGNQTRNADFLYQNTTMILDVFEAVRMHAPSCKILYTGSTCVYPKENPQPISEDRFLTGPFEETNKGYAVAKSVGIVACELYRMQYDIHSIAVMPTNMYGPNDNYDLENGHMIPSLIKKFTIAKKNNSCVTLWGTGSPRREALFSYDGADAVVYLMEHYDSPEIVNIGTGIDYSIKEFAEIIANEVGFTGDILWDTSKPDGVMEKRTDIAKLKSIYPSFSPRSFKQGMCALLDRKGEVDYILNS